MYKKLEEYLRFSEHDQPHYWNKSPKTDGTSNLRLRRTQDSITHHESIGDSDIATYDNITSALAGLIVELENASKDRVVSTAAQTT